MTDIIICDFFVLKNSSLLGKKLSSSTKEWSLIFFRFSKFNFFFSFYLSKVSNFSFFLQTLNYNFFNSISFDFNSFKKKFCNFGLVSLLYVNWLSLKAYFFCEFRIVGLGFRLKKSGNYNARFLKFDIGYGHYISYILPFEVKCIRRKRKFVLFSQDPILLNNVIQHIEAFKVLNPYKIRGLKNTRKILRVKEGKKQSQR